MAAPLPVAASTPHWWPWRALGASVITGLVLGILSVWVWTGRTGFTVLLERRPVRQLALSALILGLCMWLGFWSWRRATRDRTSMRGAFIYRFGVRSFGLLSGATSALLLAVDKAGGWSLATLGSRALLYHVLVHLVLWFPLSVWSGYWWGRAMAGVFGLPADR